MLFLGLWLPDPESRFLQLPIVLECIRRRQTFLSWPAIGRMQRGEIITQDRRTDGQTVARQRS